MSAWTPADLLPALVVVVAVLAVWELLRRWYDRLPWPELGASLLLTLVLFGPALVAGGVLLPTDQLRGWAPFRDLPEPPVHGNYLQHDLLVMIAPSGAVVRDALARGEWPQWNDRVGAGMPLLADPQAQALQPLALIGLPLGTFRAATVTAALKVELAFIFMWLLLAGTGLARGPSLLGAIAWAAGGFVLLWVGWPLSTSAVMLPGILYALSRLRRSGGRRDLVLLVTVAATTLVGGHPETIAYVVVVSVVFALDLARGPGHGSGRRFVGCCATAGALSLLLAAPGLAPTLAYLPDTVRAERLEEGPGDRGEATAASSSITGAIDRLVPLAAPNAFGNDRYLHYWGPMNTNEDAAGFVGTITLALALLAAFARDRFPQEGVVLGLGVGATGLLVVAPSVLLPGAMAWLRSPSDHHRAVMVVGFAVAFLGAAAADRLQRSTGWRWAPLLPVLVLGLLVGAAYARLAAPGEPALLDPLRWGSTVWAWRMLAAFALLAVFGRGRSWLGGGLAVLIALELLVLHRPANPTMPRELALPEVPVLSWLAERTAVRRVVGAEGVVPPNVLAIFGVADVRLHNPMAPAAIVRRLGRVDPTGEAWAPTAERFDRLAVRYRLLAPEDAVDAETVVFRSLGAVVTERASASPLATVDGRGRVRRRGPAHFVVDGVRGGALSTGIYQDGGWWALADAEAPTAEADGPFVAASLASGVGRVDLLYRAPGLLLGCLCAGLGMTILLVLTVRPPELGGHEGSRGRKSSRPGRRHSLSSMCTAVP